MSFLLLLACHPSEPARRDADAELPADAVVIDHVTIVDAGGERADRAVVMHEGRILEVRDGGVEGAVDARGMWLVPGLVDPHVHLSTSGATVYVGDALEENLRANLYFGVTQVMDLGGPESLFDLRDRIEAGELLGPRILATGPFLTAVGSHPCESWPDDTLCTFVEAGDAGAVARARLDAGADAIKVAVADGGFTPWGATPRLDLAALGDIVATGAPVIAHVDTDLDVIDAVDAGAEILAHPVFAGEMGEEALAAAASARAVHSTVGAFAGVLDVVDGTADPGAFILGEGVAANWEAVAADPEVLLDDWVEESRAWTDAARGNLPRLRDAGATVLPASDAGYWFVPHGAGLHREMKELVDAGWTPLEALTAATLSAREALDLPGGRIEAGAPADVLLLRSDPLVSVDAVSDIHAVVLRGTLWPREDLRTVDLAAVPGRLACVTVADCPEGQRCDGVDHRCVAACDPPWATAGGCGPGAWCMPADGTATDPLGACHAETGCDLYAQDCEPAAYGQACLPYDVDTSACWLAGPRGDGEPCDASLEASSCLPGLVCAYADARCRTLCDPASPSCEDGRACEGVRAEDGTPWYGLCR